MAQQDDDDDEAPPPSPWEWAVAGAGALLVLAILGFLVQDALRSQQRLPQPVVSVVRVERQQERYVVLLRAHNLGDATAARLKVRGSLEQDGSVLEESETEFDFLPGGSSREAGLFFQRDPRAHRLRIAPQSYQQP